MNEQKKYRIQDIVFPTESKHMMCKDLFYRGEMGYLNREEQTLTLGTGQICDLMTYLNSCSWAKWKKYTCAESVSLLLDIEGSYEVRVLGYSMEYGELVRKEFGTVTAHEKERENVVIDYPDNSETIVGVEITAIDKCTIYGGYYEAGYQGELNPVHISISTTTCRKEEFIKKNVALIKEKILSGDDEIKDNITLHVVDNGRTLKDEEITGDHVFLHPNPNTGGSGGFARGMIESLHQETPATHVLLMDDDVLVLPESIKLTYRLLRMLKPEYKERFISGAMLRYEKPNMQHEDIGTISQENIFKPLKPAFDHQKLKNIVRSEASYHSSDTKFSAWWYCCIPADIIKKNGLPMPFFVRGDDGEYSLRCNAKFITMKGIFVWHMGFALKFNAAMDVYQQFRNILIAGDIDDALGGINAFALFNSFLRKEIRKFNYNAVELQLRALEDYMKGPDFIRTCNGEALVKENVKLNEKYDDLTDHPEVGIYDIKECYIDTPRRAKDKLLFHLTDNGQKFCPEFLYNRPAKLPIAAFDFSIQTQKISMVKQYAAVNPYEEKVAIRTLDKKRYKELMKRYKRDTELYKKRHADIAGAYRKAKPYLTSEKFWREYLGLGK